MREIMISIQPQWVEKILNGEKTIEIRKTMPKCELPCKVYIYMTKKRHFFMANRKGEEVWYGDGLRYDKTEIVKFPKCDVRYWHLIGKVVAEFTLNEVEEYGYVYSPAMLMQGYYTKRGKELNYSRTCLKLHEIEKYADDGHPLPKPIYAWHIDNLKIYDNPKELSEFKTPPCDKPESDCRNCKYLEVINTPNAYECNCYVENGKPLKRPPQSWCYVEKVGDKND